MFRPNYKRTLTGRFRSRAWRRAFRFPIWTASVHAAVSVREARYSHLASPFVRALAALPGAGPSHNPACEPPLAPGLRIRHHDRCADVTAAGVSQGERFDD